MKILIVSATNIETSPLIKELKEIKSYTNYLTRYQYNNIKIDILISGISSINTCYHLAKTINRDDYKLILNTGIAGSFKLEIPIGSVTNVHEEIFSDLGIEDNSNFYTIFDKGLVDPNNTPFIKGSLFNQSKLNLSKLNTLKLVKGITSNTVHGNNNSVHFLKQKYDPDIETMEGAAFFYVCLLEKKPFVEIRSISNFVKERNKKNWNISLAIENLNKSVFEIIEEINHKNSLS